jgi:hypothetical protein
LQAQARAALDAARERIAQDAGRQLVERAAGQVLGAAPSTLARAATAAGRAAGRAPVQQGPPTGGG